jgi:hypothetical protein
MTKVFGNRICPECGSITGTTHDAGCPNPRSTPTTFEPDWEEIICLAVSDEPSTWGDDVRRSIAIYQRQLAEAGYVVVHRKDLAQVVRWKEPTQEAIDRLQAILS